MVIRKIDSMQSYVMGSGGTTNTDVMRAKGFFSTANGFNPPKFSASSAPGTAAIQCAYTLLDDVAIISPYDEQAFTGGLVFGARMTKPVGIAGFADPRYAFFGLYPNGPNNEAPIAVYDPFNNFNSFFEDGFSHLVISVNQSPISGEILIPWAAGQWKYFEVGYVASSGTIVLRVDGVEYFRSSGHNPTISQQYNIVYITGQVAALTGGYIYFQDAYVADVSDGLIFHGPCQVVHARPTEPGSAMGFEGTEGGSVVSLVSERHVDHEESKIQTSKADSKALFRTALGYESALAVEVTNIVANRGVLDGSDAADACVVALLRVDGVESSGLTVHLPCREQNSWDVATSFFGDFTHQGWINAGFCSENSPDGQPWTGDKLGELEFGVKTIGLVEAGVLTTSVDFGVQTRAYYPTYPGCIQVRVENQTAGITSYSVIDSTSTRVVSVNLTTNIATVHSSTLPGIPDEVNYILTVSDGTRIQLRVYDATTGELFGTVSDVSTNGIPDSRSIEVTDAVTIDRAIWVTEGFIDQLTIA